MRITQMGDIAVCGRLAWQLIGLAVSCHVREYRELLIKAARGAPEVSKDRFLVLSIGIDDATFDHISGLPTEAKADEVNAVDSMSRPDFIFIEGTTCAYFETLVVCS